MATVTEPATPVQAKRGRPRAAEGTLRPAGEKSRLYRARIMLEKLSAAGRDIPPELLDLPPRKKRGRPRLSDDDIDLPDHAPARRSRDCRAKAEQLKKEAQAEAALLLLHVHHEGGGSAIAEAEALAAKLQARQRREAHKLDSLAADGTDFDGPAHTGRIRAFVREDDAGDAERKCVICMCVPDVPAVARPMKCCGHGFCEPCLEEWFGRKGQRADPGYEDGVQGVSHVRRGRPVAGAAGRWTRIGVRRARRLFSVEAARVCAA